MGMVRMTWPDDLGQYRPPDVAAAPRTPRLPRCGGPPGERTCPAGRARGGYYDLAEPGPGAVAATAGAAEEPRRGGFHRPGLRATCGGRMRYHHLVHRQSADLAPTARSAGDDQAGARA